MRERPPDTYHSPENTLMECPKAAPPVRVAAQTSSVSGILFFWSWRRDSTPDRLITNQMLYRLSYASRWKHVPSGAILP